MPLLKFNRKSSSPDVIRIRDTNREFCGRKIPSLTEIDLRPDLNTSECNRGSRFSTFRNGITSSISSPNLIDSKYSKKPINGTDLCPICLAPFSDQTESRVPRLLPCLHTVCTGCLQRAENFLVFLTKSGSAPNRPTRYSWRRRSARALLGNFVCPFCHGMTSIFSSDGVRALPISKLIRSTSFSRSSESPTSSLNRQRLGVS